MATYIVVCNIQPHSSKHAQVREALEAYPACRQIHDSVWIVNCPLTARGIAANLGTFVTEEDKLFIASLCGEASWSGYEDGLDEWLDTVL